VCTGKRLTQANSFAARISVQDFPGFNFEQ
jgi:hypothetical protein